MYRTITIALSAIALMSWTDAANATAGEDLIAQKLIQQTLENNADGQTGELGDPHGSFVVKVTPIETRTEPFPCRSFIATIERTTNSGYNRPNEKGGVACRNDDGYWEMRGNRFPSSTQNANWGGGYAVGDKDRDGEVCERTKKSRERTNVSNRQKARILSGKAGLEEILTVVLSSDSTDTDTTCKTRW